MMMTVRRARDPRWNDAAHTSISLYVTFEETKDTLGEMPFTATEHDSELHGKELFASAVAGDFGAVAAYAPAELTEDQQRELWKAQREQLVAAITVTTTQGNTFDGDEISQGRMARAILGLQSQPEGSTVQWVLTDNTVLDVGIAELQQALTLAGLRQTELWVQA
ncbi:hypothetical protein D3C87_1300370 [compost metagenome]